jgi:hypothetical protein
MKHPDDDDYEIERDLWLAPATDGILGGFFQHGMEHFEGLASPTAMSQLSEAGILVRGWDVISLGAALRTFHGFPSVHYSKEAIDREQQISELSAQLHALLATGEGEQDGWRTYWGDVDWSDFDETLEAPEPTSVINVPDLMESLGDLKNAADERLEWLHSAKFSGIDPGNRAGRIRYFYWLILIAFWKFQLQREVGTSTSLGKDAYGPLIKFIQVMSAQGMSDEEIHGDTIRAFIRRHEGREDHFREYFTPHSKAL